MVTIACQIMLAGRLNEPGPAETGLYPSWVYIASSGTSEDADLSRLRYTRHAQGAKEPHIDSRHGRKIIGLRDPYFWRSMTSLIAFFALLRRFRKLKYIVQHKLYSDKQILRATTACTYLPLTNVPPSASHSALSGFLPST